MSKTEKKIKKGELRSGSIRTFVDPNIVEVDQYSSAISGSSESSSVDTDITEELYFDATITSTPNRTQQKSYAEVVKTPVSENKKTEPDQEQNSHSNQIIQFTSPEEITMTTKFDFAAFYKSIPEFDGNINDLNRFVACCDQFYEQLGADNDKQATFLKALVRKFLNRAFDFYNKKQWASWTDLKNELKSYFSTSQTLEGYQIELTKLKQSSLTVREFGEKIDKILVEMNKISSDFKIGNESGSKFFKIQNEKLAIKSFINGLIEPFKTILRSRKFSDLQAAIKDAIVLENEEKLSDLSTLKVTGEKGEEITQIKNVLADNNVKTKESFNNNGITNARIICFKCGTPGHMANKCVKSTGFQMQNNRYNRGNPFFKQIFVPNQNYPNPTYYANNDFGNFRQPTHNVRYRLQDFPNNNNNSFYNNNYANRNNNTANNNNNNVRNGNGNNNRFERPTRFGPNNGKSGPNNVQTCSKNDREPSMENLMIDFVLQ